MNISLHSPKIPNIIMGIVLVLIFAYLYAEFYLPGRLYWSYVNATSFDFADTVCDLIPLIGIGTLVIWIFRQIYQGYEHSVILYFFSILGAVFLTAALLLASLGAVFAKSPSQIQEISVADYVYRVAYFPPAGSGGSYFELFQCDSLGLLCDRLHGIAVEGSPDITDYPHLVSKSGQIILVKSGETIYEQKLANS
jgi:hypothetical protein